MASTIHSVCSECGSRFEQSSARTTCFRCHVGTIRLGFTHGKEDFHGDTFRQRQVEQEHLAAAAGIKAERVGERWV